MGNIEHDIFLSDNDIKRKKLLITNIPILKQLVADRLCHEDAIIAALKLVQFEERQYIYCQGQIEPREMYFLESGNVLITKKRSGVVRGLMRLPTCRRTAQDADLEIEIDLHTPNECFGEMILLRHRYRHTNAIAIRTNAVCWSMQEDKFRSLLEPLHDLLVYRNLLRSHKGLNKHRLFLDFENQQKNYMIERTTLEKLNKGDFICRQGDEAETYYIIVEGEANVVVQDNLPVKTAEKLDSSTGCDDKQSASTSPEATLGINPKTNICSEKVKMNQETESDCIKSSCASVIGSHLISVDKVSPTNDAPMTEISQCTPATPALNTSIVAHISLYQGAGEMGLLRRPRKAHVIAMSDSVICLVIHRKTYEEVLKLRSKSGDNIQNSGSAELDEVYINTLLEEWNILEKARNMRFKTPRVTKYVVVFIQKLKIWYAKKFTGKTLYRDFFMRLHKESEILNEFPTLASRLSWETPISSLGIIRSQTRRILMLPPEDRTLECLAFLGRLLEHVTFLDKFDIPVHIDKYKLARTLAKYVKFTVIQKGKYIFYQGKIDPKAFIIIRGQINVINEDVVNSTASTMNSGNANRNVIIATLISGHSVGEMSLMANLPRSASGVAGSDTDLLVVDADNINVVTKELQGLRLRNVMIDRANFLAKSGIFHGSDISQCIRVAFDTVEQIYEPHHVFIQASSQEKTLYIIKSGEIAIFLKKNLPTRNSGKECSSVSPHLITTPPSASKSFQSSYTGSWIIHTSETITAKFDTVSESIRGLVRVATIGPQEYFAFAIGNAIQMLNATGTSTVFSDTTHNNQQPPYKDLTNMVFMCQTVVETLELPERAWRQLSTERLQKVCNTLLERSRWNHEYIDNLKNMAYYSMEKPWQPLSKKIQWDTNPLRFAKRNSATLHEHHILKNISPAGNTPKCIVDNYIPKATSPKILQENQIARSSQICNENLRDLTGTSSCAPQSTPSMSRGEDSRYSNLQHTQQRPTSRKKEIRSNNNILQSGLLKSPLSGRIKVLRPDTAPDLLFSIKANSKRKMPSSFYECLSHTKNTPYRSLKGNTLGIGSQQATSMPLRAKNLHYRTSIRNLSIQSTHQPQNDVSYNPVRKTVEHYESSNKSEGTSHETEFAAMWRLSSQDTTM